VRASLRPEKYTKAILVLEDGSYFIGRGFGAVKKVSGEVVFSTSMVGYPEALTDPSYKGQILTLTYPLVGNYGVPPYKAKEGIQLRFESEGIKANGLIVHELCTEPSHWASTRTLAEWLEEEDIPGIYGIDTRKLTKKLRGMGVLLGVLKICENGEDPNIERLSEEAENVSDPNLRDLVKEVTVKEPVFYGSKGNKTVVVVDCGVKHGILMSLIKRGLKVIRVPYDFSAKEILEYSPSGIVVSNGPGDPKKCTSTISCVQELLMEGTPTMGVCFGNQILALALGGNTYKLKYGHRSQNQPALDVETNRCYITAQNHGFAVDADSLRDTGLKSWFINANDKTVEGIKHTSKPIFAVQFHPEANPGPYDTGFLFNQFVRLMEN